MSATLSLPNQYVIHHGLISYPNHMGNTMAAYHSAFNTGFWSIEIDVALLKPVMPGEELGAICCHDHLIGRYLADLPNLP